MKAIKIPEVCRSGISGKCRFITEDDRCCLHNLDNMQSCTTKTLVDLDEVLGILDNRLEYDKIHHVPAVEETTLSIKYEIKALGEK